MPSTKNITPEKFKILLGYLDKLNQLHPQYVEYGVALPIHPSALERAKIFLFCLKEHKLLKAPEEYEISCSPEEQDKKEIINKMKDTEDIDEKWGVLHELIPEIEYYVISIYPTKTGGIRFSWVCHVSWADVIIPPEEHFEINYES